MAVWVPTAAGTAYDYNTAANWSPTTVPNAAGAAADFTSAMAGAQTVTISSSVTVGTITLADSNATYYATTLQAAANQTLTLNNSGSTPTITVNNIGSTISAPLVGTSGFNKAGSTTLTLTGSLANLTGTININSGGGSITVTPGTAYTFSGDITGAASTSVTKSGANVLTLTGATISVPTLTISGATTFAPASGTQTVSSAIAGTSTITKDGAGTTVFSGSGSNTGAWTVSTGTLSTTNTQSGTSGTITVSSGATFTHSGSGTLSKPLTINSGGSATLSAKTAGTIIALADANGTTSSQYATLNLNSNIDTTTTPDYGLYVNGRGVTIGAGVTLVRAYQISLGNGSTAVTGANQVSRLTVPSGCTLEARDGSSTITRIYIGASTASDTTNTAIGAIYNSGTVQITAPGGSGGLYLGIGLSSYGYYETRSGGAVTLNPGAVAIGSLGSASALGSSSVLALKGGNFSTGGGGVYFNGNPAASSLLLIESGTFSASLLQVNTNRSYTGKSGGTPAIVIGGGGSAAALTLTGATTNITGGDSATGSSYSTLVLRTNGTFTATAFTTSATSLTPIYIGMRGGTFKLTTAGTTVGATTLTNAAFHCYEGGTLDGSTAFKIAIPVLAASGSGVTDQSYAISSKGANYIGPPTMKLSGGSGVGAVVLANWNSSNTNLDSVEVLCPGVDYTSAPTITPEGGGSTSTATMPSLSVSANSGYAAALTALGTVTFASATANTFKALLISGVSAVVNYGDGTAAHGASSVANVTFSATTGKLVFNMASSTTTPVEITGTIGTDVVAGRIEQGANGITKLSGNNRVNTDAAITVTAGGALELANDNAAGNVGALGNAITVQSGAALRFSGNITTPARPISLNGSGQTGAAKGAIHNVSGTNTCASLVSLVTASVINSEAGTLTLSKTGDTISLPNTTGTLTFGVSGSGGGNVTVAGRIKQGTATYALTKTGTGTTRLEGTDSDFSGAVEIVQGKLEVGSVANAGTTSSLGTGSSTAAITLRDNTTLSFIGSASCSTTRSVLAGDTATNPITIDASGSAGVTFATVSLGVGGAGVTKTLRLGGTSNAANVLSAVVANPSTGTGALTKIDAGTWESSAANTFTGALTQSDGTLIVSGTNATNTVTLNGGTCKLKSGSGATNRFGASSTVTVNSGATLNPVSTNSQNGKQAYNNLTLSAGSKIRLGGTV